jgi:F420H(2)-dependent quinone reductase
MSTTGHRQSHRQTRAPLRHVNAAVHLLLRTPWLRRTLDGTVCELRFTGRHSGRPVALPVMYAEHGDQVVVLVGQPAGKRWWRNFLEPHPVQARLRGVLRAGVGHVVHTGSADRAEACSIYADRFPDVPAQADPFVSITLAR